jgi:hypothetical protein
VNYVRRRVYGGPAGPVGRLTVSGPYFVDAQGQLVIRKSLTAFTAPKRFMEGRGHEARAYFDWAASQGFNEVRVFTRVDWTGPPSSGVETGWPYSESDCEAMLREAAAAGLRVELVAHTYDSALDEMADHLRRVDALAQHHDNALLEVANEPHVNDIDVAALLSRYTPQTPGWSSGLAPLPYPAGQSLTQHTDRKEEWPRCFKDAYEFYTGAGPSQPFSPPFKGPVMLDEPPQVEQTIRDYPQHNAVDDWRAYGAGCAFFAAGGTLHGHPTFQKCEIPTDPTVLACVSSFIAGFADVPLQRYSGYSHPDDQGSLRRYRRQGADGRTYEISVRPYGFRPV